MLFICEQQKNAILLWLIPEHKNNISTKHFVNKKFTCIHINQWNVKQHISIIYMTARAKIIKHLN